MHYIYVILYLFIFFFLCLVRINDTVTFVEDGYDEDIEFGYEVSEGEDNVVDNVSILKFYTNN